MISTADNPTDQKKPLVAMAEYRRDESEASSPRSQNHVAAPRIMI